MEGLFLLIALVFALYPFVAIGRIWYYSSQQVQLLRDIKAALESQQAARPDWDRHVGSAIPPSPTTR